MALLQIATLLEGTCKYDPERVGSALEMLFDWNSMSTELVVGSELQ